MDEIEQIEQNRGGPCNTEGPQEGEKPKAQGAQHFYWSFVWNNYEIDQIDQLIQICLHECDWYVWQEEVGEKTHTPHIQGTLKLKKKQRMTALKKWNKKISWRATECIGASICYASKVATRAGRQWFNGIDIPGQDQKSLDQQILDEYYHDVAWKPWQQMVIDICLTKPDSRKIYWFWERNGNVGKSYLVKYIDIIHDCIIGTGKKNDIYNEVLTWCQENRGKSPKVVVCDVPRYDIDYINYGAIEQIKNGHLYSGKYKGGKVRYKHPHVFIFANTPPDLTVLSADRWIIYEIGENEIKEQ